MDVIRNVVSMAKAESAFWDSTQGFNGKELKSVSIPGYLIQFILDNMESRESANRAIGILTANAARRALACWFVYCDNSDCLVTANKLLEYWGSAKSDITIDSKWYEPVIPISNGELIDDCREDDTGAASEAVAEAAKYAGTLDYDCAIKAIAYAHHAFSATPLPSVYDTNMEAELEFETWMIEIAVPRVMSGESLTAEEQNAFILYDIPAVMQKQNWIPTNSKYRHSS